MSHRPCNPLRIAALSAIVLVALLVPASGAFASTMSESGTTVTFSAAGGIDNDLILSEDAGNEELTIDTSDDPVESNHSTGAITADCDDIDGNTADDADLVLCTDVDAVIVNTKGGQDDVDATGLDTIVATLNGDFGDDILRGGDAPAGDTLNGGEDEDELYGNEGSDDLNGGSDNDYLEGNDDDDTLRGGPSDDDLYPGNDDDNSDGEGGNDYTEELDDGGIDHSRGGAGLDELYYDGQAFGCCDEDDDIDINEDSQTDDGDTLDDPENRFDEFENVDYSIADDANAHVLTTGGNDSIDGSDEVDVLTPRAGVDRLEMKDNNDTANTVDGYPDVVNCGAGDDVANADQFDELNSCEDVNITQVPSAFDPNTPEDVPPSVAFSNLDPNAFLPPIGTQLQATASDDVGVVYVLFFDDVEGLCADSTAPYTCEWEQTTEDVGENVLTAIAIDTAGQLGTDIQSVTVGKFNPDELETQATKRDLRGPRRTRVSGMLDLPSGVSPEEGCEGDVRVRILDGTDRIRSRRVPLQEDCEYSHRFRLPGVAKIEHERVKIKTKFLGNEVLKKEKADVVKTKVQDL